MNQTLTITKALAAFFSTLGSRAHRTYGKPCLEALEDRTVLSELLWNPLGADRSWSNAKNWVVFKASDGSGDTVKLNPTHQPQAGDILIFNRTNTGDSVNNLDLTGKNALAWLKIERGYTGTITLNKSVSAGNIDLTSKAIITGAGDLTVLDDAAVSTSFDGVKATTVGTFIWKEGTIAGTGKVIVSSNAQLTVSSVKTESTFRDAGDVPTLSGRTLIIRPRPPVRGPMLPDWEDSQGTSSYQMVLIGSMSLAKGASIQAEGAILAFGTADQMSIFSSAATGKEAINIVGDGVFRVVRPGKSLAINGVGFNNLGAGIKPHVLVLGTLRLAGGGTNTATVQLGHATDKDAFGTLILGFGTGKDPATYGWGKGTDFTGQGVIELQGSRTPLASFTALGILGGKTVTLPSSISLLTNGKTALLGSLTIRGSALLFGTFIGSQDDSGELTVANAAKVVVGRDFNDAGLAITSVLGAKGKINVQSGGRLTFTDKLPEDDFTTSLPKNLTVLPKRLPTGSPLLTPRDLGKTFSSAATFYFQRGSAIAVAGSGTVELDGQTFFRPFGTGSDPKLVFNAGSTLSKLVGPRGGLPSEITGFDVRFVGKKNIVDVPKGAGDLKINGTTYSADPVASPASGGEGVEYSGTAEYTAAVMTTDSDAVLSGTGTTDSAALVNNGMLSPGTASHAGHLQLGGFVLLTSTSVIDINIFGSAASSAFDDVRFTDPTVLGGNLTVNLNGYTPSAGEAFTILGLPSGYSGTFDTVVAPTFSSGAYSFQVNYNATDVTLTVISTPSAPTVSGATSSSGSTAGGQSVVIAGTNFSAVQGVMFGSTPVLGYTVNSSTQITAIAPPNAAGSTTISVVTEGGSASTGYTYVAATAPAVSALSSSSGYLTGGKQVTITGTDFTGATAVLFGSTPADFFAVNSSTSITAYAPKAASAGTVDVRVTTYSGTSAAVSADQFTYSQQPAPTVSALGTATGSSAGGTAIAITGTTFENVTGVFFGGVAADFTVNSTTSITATAPPGIAGTVDVTVQTFGGTSALSSADRFTYTAAPAPALTALSAMSGTTAGGTLVTITGTHFTGSTGVFFGQVRASFVVLSDTAVLAVAPPQTTGTVDVTVVTTSGTSAQSSADLFTYNAASAPTVTGLGTTSGGTGGGTVVTVTGTNLTAATGVKFGSVDAEGFYVLSDTALVAWAPAQAAATVHVTVTTDGGTSSTSSSDQYTYNAASAPTVTGLSSSSGPATGGTSVLISGTDLRGTTSVLFGTEHAYFEVQDDSTILAYAPFGAAGTVDVMVTTYSGTSSTSSADQFTYTSVSAPAISSLSTSSGNTAGGTVVTITGTGLDNVSAVYFGDTPVYDFTLNSDTQLTVVAPANYAGTYDIVVRGPGGDSARSSSTRFSYSLASAPAISSIATSSGSSAGGTEVVITGTDFSDATAVTFGDVGASFRVDSPTQITAWSPSQAAGTVDIRVFTHAGSSTPASADHFTFNAASAPAVTSLATASGSTGGGTLVTLTGTDFTGATSVTFGTVEASFVVNSDTSITAWSPSQAAGTVNVRVTTPSGTSSTGAGNQFTFNSAGAPSVSSLLATTGDTAAGTAVTVVGSGFSGATDLKFGTVSASFSVISDTVILAYSPMQAAGTVHITVTTPSGTSSTSSADQFTYTNLTASAPAVTGLDLTTGSTAGGATVVITGTDFTGASGVSFGANAANSFSIDSDTQITAVAPAGSAGAAHVTVTTNNGTSSTSSADQFTYLSTPAPAVTSLGTSSGSTAGGTSVSITGTNFTGATAVFFGNVPAASFVVNSGTSITATSPSSYAGLVDITVVTPSGTSATSSSDHYTFNAASLPAITSLGTSTGSTAGGTSVSITGTDFTGATGVYFGGIAATSFVVNSSTSITATTPASYAGTVDVTVVTTAGKSAPASAARFSFTAASAPTVSSLGTSSGSTAGGTPVTITGTNFAGVTAVFFGGMAADFTVNSSTSITATSPVEDAGTVDVVVWTTAGSSQVSSSDHYTFNAASAPTVTSLGTSSGSSAGGTTVVITGTNFTSATQVLFGTVAASYTVDSSTQITATAPPQAAGTVDVTVTTGGGTSATSSSDHYTYNAASAPSVSGRSTTSGSAAGGTAVVLSGSNFTATTSVLFGTDEASFRVLSDSAILAYAPGGSGTVHITVTTTSGTSSTSSSDQFTYTSVTAPTISSLSASSGSTAGGTSLTITGTGFLDATSVTFGGVQADFLVVSDTTITVTTPANTAGGVDVVVSIPGADSTPARFTFTAASAPAVTSLGTSSGSTAGGTSVVITGTDFTGASAVFFGDQAAASFTVNSSTQITAVSPVAAAAGTVDVVVQTPTGTSEVSSSDHYTYSAASAPTLSALSLSSGPAAGGTAVNLTGTNYTGTTSVKFGTLEASFQIKSSTWIVATAPAASSGTVSVTATSAGGTSSGVNFTYNTPSAPTVSGLSDASGPDYGGETITVLGSNFTGATGVQFGTADASFTVISDNAIRATVPAGTAGTVDVTVTTAGGTSSTSSADHYVYSSGTAPAVSSLSASSGGGAGGTLVTITGTGFSDATQVLFGSVPASSWVVNSATKITAVSPPHASGTVDVTVSNPAGTSSTSSSDHFTFSAASSPTVTAVTTAGPTAGGNSVLVTGTNFLGASDVKFGSTSAASFTALSATSILAVAPSGSAGTVHVTVTTPAATSSTSSADQYTYQAAPTISSLSASTDTATGGIPITITGTNFTGASAVYFGDVAVTSFTVNSSTSITVVVPAHAAGSVGLSVYAPGGESSTTTFTYTSATTVTWTGGSSGSWGTGANWSGGVVPSGTDDVVIPNGSTVTLSSGSGVAHRLSVAGALTVSGGTLTVNAASAIDTLTVSGGTMDGAGAVTVGTSFSWSGGTLGGTGDFTIDTAATGTMSGTTVTRSNGSMINKGSTTWTGDTFGLNYGFVNLGSFTASRSSGTQSVSGTAAYTNIGTFTKSGAGTTSFGAAEFYANPGTVAVNAGILSLSLGFMSGTATVASGAELQISGNFQLLSTAQVTGSGTLRITGGTTTLGGTISVSGGVIIDSGATAQGTGTVSTNLTNNGTLIVGTVGSVGVLAITGNFTQGAGGTLKMDINGTGAGTGYDQLQVSGSVTLAGTLNMTVTGSYAPGTQFTLLTFASRTGTFGAITGAGAMIPQYNATTFKLLAFADVPFDDSEDGPAKADDAPKSDERPEQGQEGDRGNEEAPRRVPRRWREDEVAPAVVFVSAAAVAAPQDAAFARWADGQAGGDGGFSADAGAGSGDGSAEAGPDLPSLDQLLALPLTLLESLLSAGD